MEHERGQIVRILVLSLNCKILPGTPQIENLSGQLRSENSHLISLCADFERHELPQHALLSLHSREIMMKF